MQKYDKIYINGKWIAPQGTDKALEVFDSTNEEVMASIPSCNTKDVDAAAQAARAAFIGWAALDVQERAKYMNRIGDGIAARMDELATAISRETGMTKLFSQMIQVGLPIASCKQAAIVAEAFVSQQELGSALVVHEPIGVVGCITPWNFPLHQIIAKVAFAMAAGCTVILKPSEVAPIDAFILAEIIDEIGLPAGVFNLVTGTGPVVGEAMAAHKEIDMISFTGSTRAGRRVTQVAAETVKKVQLELGGKSANIICEDLDTETFAKAVKSGVGNAFLNSGQACVAMTRMLVPRSRLAEAETIATEVTSAMKVGDPFEQTTNLGPLASAAQRDRVNGYIQKGIDEGAKLLIGGVGVPEGCGKGYYVKPTVFSNVKNSMTIAQEEIFGPVLSIIAYEDEDDAVRIANDTIYGLSGGVWASTKEKGMEIARRIRTGHMIVNGGKHNVSAPVGGYKQSGVGREYGEHGFREFLEVKNIQL